MHHAINSYLIAATGAVNRVEKVPNLPEIKIFSNDEDDLYSIAQCLHYAVSLRNLNYYDFTGNNIAIAIRMLQTKRVFHSHAWPFPTLPKKLFGLAHSLGGGGSFDACIEWLSRNFTYGSEEDYRKLEHLAHRIFRTEVKIQKNFISEITPRPNVMISKNTDVLNLARNIDEEGCYQDLPILADALEEAGCNDDQVLSHCRKKNHCHIPGCWVIDQILERR
jgi:hypothetical protein